MRAVLLDQRPCDITSHVHYWWYVWDEHSGWYERDYDFRRKYKQLKDGKWGVITVKRK